MIVRFDTILAGDRQTDVQTERNAIAKTVLSIAACCNKANKELMTYVTH